MTNSEAQEFTRILRKVPRQPAASELQRLKILAQDRRAREQS